MPKTLYDKIWSDHLVHQQDDGTSLLFVDRHLIHEVTSPQAFEGLRNSKRNVRHPNLTLAVVDHNIPTTDRSKGIDDNDSRIQVETLEKNCKDFDIKLFGMNDKRQGIVHIVGPELSLIHISEPTRLLSISYAVFCLKKKSTDPYGALADGS